MNGYPKQHNVIHLSIGAATAVALCAIIVGGSIIASAYQPATSEDSRPGVLPRLGVTGLAGSNDSMEAAYGPVNKGALNEAKQGLFDRVRARRTSRMNSCCVPQSQAIQYVATRYVITGPGYSSNPVPLPSGLTQPVYRQPLNAPNCPTCPLEIAPSRSPSDIRGESIEDTYGPLNKAALGERKQSTVTSLLSDPGDVGELPSSLGPRVDQTTTLDRQPLYQPTEAEQPYLSTELPNPTNADGTMRLVAEAGILPPLERLPIVASGIPDSPPVPATALRIVPSK
ncbi:hypothetical protein [Aureliella helgolandensis]|uniref:Uncharacterized protein n=1 Tax=Aureliella helgolandensis TaxID=2527968 RepID=A0A518G4P5_9BACT|nr:hypothetical protein [Aureliella helgolandensis]QDV23571.1 hypothetical protein Q31a_18730 [Aureliella helgolandensis]